MKENATAILQPRPTFGCAQSVILTTRVRRETFAGVDFEVVRTSKGSRRFTVKDPVTGLRVLPATVLCYSADDAMTELRCSAMRAVSRDPRPFAEFVAASRAEWAPKLRVTYPAA
jgi:hypothetical protein